MDALYKDNFLLYSINTLGKDHFDQFVKIFQSEYWDYEDCVNIDGPNDGGKDMLVYCNKEAKKKCVQVTIQKDNIEGKLKRDLKKVENKIKEEGYENRFEFYWNQNMSEEKVEELKKFAIKEHGINLEIYDGKRLSQLKCPLTHEFIWNLFGASVIKPQDLDLSKTEKFLYDILAKGNDTYDIKQSLIESFIILTVYELDKVNLEDLRNEVEKRTGLTIPAWLPIINKLKSDQRIINIDKPNKIIGLSEKEANKVRDILSIASIEEKEFIDSLQLILEKNGIEYKSEVVDLLKYLFSIFYAEREKIEKDTIANKVKRFDKLKIYINDHKNKEIETDKVIENIWNLCKNNSYINKVCASGFFLKLYKSNQLEAYINLKHKDIFIDTPVFLYFLCYYYGLEDNDWINTTYSSAKALFQLWEHKNSNISLYIYDGYLEEVAGEIYKALCVDEFAKLGDLGLGNSRNIIYNFYRYLEENNILDENIHSLKDFLRDIGLKNLNPHHPNFFAQTTRDLVQIAIDNNIDIKSGNYEENFQTYKKEYEIILSENDRRRSPKAVIHDINLMLIALQNNPDSDTYFTTWDGAIHLIRDKMIEMNPHFESFYIYNPSVLTNKLGLENFQLENSAISNEIFIYADNEYELSGKMIELIDILASYLDINEEGSRLLTRKLGILRKRQLEQRIINDEDTRGDTLLPIEEVLLLLVPSKEMIEEDVNIVRKFRKFLSSEENIDYIMTIIHEMLSLPNPQSYDLQLFFNRVRQFSL